MVVVEKGDRAERTGEMIGLNREQRDKVYFPTRTYGRMRIHAAAAMTASTSASIIDITLYPSAQQCLCSATIRAGRCFELNVG